MMSSRLTIVDIAKMAGVSRSTVSRAINDDREISPETKAKILEVIASVNFRPNVNARRTVTRTCNCLGLYIGSRVWIRDANSRVLSGVIQKCNEASYDLVLRSSCSPERLLEMYNERKVDGFVILNPYPHNAPMLELLEKNAVPYACTAVCSGEDVFAYVDTDNRRAAYEAVQYLIGLGHRNIAFLTEKDSILSVELRRAGYEQCLKDHGISLSSRYLICLKPSRDRLDFTRVQEVLRGPDSATAFFAATDDMAMRTIDWLYNNGFRVPEDVSVIGFDDLPEAILGRPLTTVRQDFYGRGYVACENVLEQLRDGVSPPRKMRRFLPCTLIERGTVRPLCK